MTEIYNCFLSAILFFDDEMLRNVNEIQTLGGMKKQHSCP